MPNANFNPLLTQAADNLAALLISSGRGPNGEIFDLEECADMEALHRVLPWINFHDTKVSRHDTAGENAAVIRACIEVGNHLEVCTDVIVLQDGARIPSPKEVVAIRVLAGSLFTDPVGPPNAFRDCYQSNEDRARFYENRLGHLRGRREEIVLFVLAYFKPC